METCNYSDNLEKLRLANNLANQILNNKTNTKFDAINNSEFSDTKSPISETRFVEKNLESKFNINTNDSCDPKEPTPKVTVAPVENISINYQQDLWGSNNLVEENEKFQFVKDYMLQSDRLLNLSKTIKPSSYETVKSTSDLYPLPDNKLSLKSINSQHNEDVFNAEHGEDFNYVDVLNNLTRLKENGFRPDIPELLTHRPVFEDEKPLNVLSVHQPNLQKFNETKSSFSTDDFLKIDPTKALDNQQEQKFQEIDDDRNEDKLLAPPSPDIIPRSLFLGELLDLTKSSEPIELENSIAISENAHTSNRNDKQAKNTEHIDTIKINNGAYDFDVHSSNEKEPAKSMELSNPLKNVTQSFTYSRDFIKNNNSKTNMASEAVHDSSPKKMTRPKSASMANSNNNITKDKLSSNNSHQSKTSPSKTRPCSASKVWDAKSNKSPKRVWETSGIEWSAKNRQRKLNFASKDPINNNATQLLTKQKHLETEITLPWIDKRSMANGNIQFLKSNYCKNIVTNIGYLSDEMLLHIFSFLSFKDLANISQVSTRLNEVSTDPVLWKNIKCENRSLCDDWFEAMGYKQPKTFTLTKCSGKQVNNRGLRQFFNGCKLSLKELEIAQCTGDQLSGDSILLHASCRCKSIEKLVLPWSGTTDNGLMAICLSLSAISHLNINGNSLITDESFQVFIDRHASTLRTLEMAGCFSVSNQSLLQLANNAQLSKLNIGLCNKVTTECITSLCSKLKHLQVLDLHGLRAVTDQCTHTIVKNCNNLVTLVLANCSSISDVAMSEIATYLPGINTLDVSGCSLISNNGICNLISVAKSLINLDISSTSATYISVNSLTQCSYSLKTFKVSFCRQITQRSLEKLLNNCPLMQSLHIYGLKNLNFARLVKINKRVVVEK